MEEGNNFIEKYHGGLQKLLESIYPENEWIPWFFVQVQPRMIGKMSNKLN